MKSRQEQLKDKITAINIKALYRKFSSKLSLSRAKNWWDRQSLQSLIAWSLGTLLLGVVLFSTTLIFLVWKGFFGPLPTYAQLANIQNNQASEIYDARGISIGKYYIENRINADSSELPAHLIKSLVATEDARFFEHGGIDIKSLGRVLIKSILLSQERSGGGSTISQQLAKNLYPRKEYAFFSIVISKLKEMLIARRLEKVFEKDQILRMYLNTVPFEGNAFGVKIASQRFFDKSLDQLDVGEAAVLIGMLKATSYYNPVRYPERAKERRNTVLNQMVKFGYLSADSAQTLINQDIKSNYQPESHDLGLATYFRAHLRAEVDEKLKAIQKPDGTTYNLYTDGLKVYTSIDATMQRYAEEVVRAHLKSLQKTFLKEWKGEEPWFTKDLREKQIKNSARYRHLEAQGFSEEEIRKTFDTPVKMVIFDWDAGEKEVEMTPLDSIRYYLTLLRAGMLVVEPGSGVVRAWVGGIDHRFIQYDHVKSKRQIGSIMKPIVYAAAIRDGIQPCEYFENRLVSYPEYKNWEPRNSDEFYGGYFSMEGALTNSVNTVAVETALEVGIEPIRQLAIEMGIDENLPGEPAIALGAVDASLWQMARVYATLANEGVRPVLSFLDRIETADGQVLVRPEKKTDVNKRILNRDEAATLTHFLQSVVDSGTARRLRYEYNLNGAIAGKTGTTQNQSDGWFMGYTPGLLAGVWVGAEIPAVHFKTTHNGQGANTALPIWGLFMQRVQKNKRTSRYMQGSFQKPVDTLLALLDCPHYLPELPEFFDSILDVEQLLEFSQVAAEIDTSELKDILRKSPRKDSETLSEYSQRIREKNEKILEKRERKKKRKKFFDKIFGREQ
ncbi:MAG: penicillin-binding protein [Saprospiraceae bacterium]|nr:penicillin-binding protein [Saprospiraceae bacterium]